MSHFQVLFPFAGRLRSASARGAAATTVFQVLSPALLAVVLIGAPLYWGALEAFPIYDDGWLVLILREGSAGMIQASMPDRPLFGAMLGFLCQVFGGAPAALVAIAVFLNVLLAVEAGLLWRVLFPGMAQFDCLASALAMSTILVQSQLCTLMVALPCVLPVVATLAALLLLLKAQESSAGKWRLVLALAGLVTAGAVLFSEYAIAATAANLAILAGSFLHASDAATRRRLIRAMALLSFVSVASYLLFLQVTHLGVSRPSVSPEAARGVMGKSIASVVVNFVNGCWHASLGAFASAMGQISVDWSGKTTILATVYGVFTALLLGVGVHAGGGLGMHTRPRLIHPAALLLAIGAGLAPVALMGRGTALPGFGSRFLIPVLPVAAVTTVFILVRLARARFAWVAIVAIGLTAASASVTFATSARRERRQFAPLSDSLRPQVSADPGFTVAVLSQQGIDYELTARVTAPWPLESAKNFWMFDLDHGLAAYGPRKACLEAGQINQEVRLIRRSGFVRRLLWVDVSPDRAISIQPYCQGNAQ